MPLPDAIRRRAMPLLLAALLPAVTGVRVLSAAGSASQRETASQKAWALADQARQIARTGEAREALPLYRAALDLAPEILAIRRDYAVVLGWAERFSEAKEQFQRVLESQPDQPEWVWREIAQTELMAGDPATALASLDRAIEAGDASEKTLARKALALRRLHQSEQAEAIYRRIHEQFPHSETGIVGMVQSLGDRGQFQEALAVVDQALIDRPGDWRLLCSKGQVLNWLGRHREALEVFEAVPRPYAAEREIIKGRFIALFGSQAGSHQEINAAVGAGSRLSLWPPIVLPDPPLELKTDPARIEQLWRERPWQFADAARELARAGSTGEALALYRMALDLAPEEVSLQRDYAVVLGWAERYAEAEQAFDRLLQKDPNPPEWVLRELARTRLFGKNPKSAIEVLDAMIAAGNNSEETLSRKALALRWSNQSDQAEKLYRQLAEQFPRSSAATVGIIQSLADQNKLLEAIEFANDALRQRPGDWTVLKAKGQVLNWAGRHLEAQRVFSSIPFDHWYDGEVIHGRALAARWGDDPAAARRYAVLFAEKHPLNPEAKSLQRELSLEHGSSFESSVRLFSDSQQFAERAYTQRFSFHTSPSQSFHFGHQYRRFSQEGVVAWNRYEAGWSGKLRPRLTSSVSLADLEYSQERGDHSWIGDASLAWKIDDRLQLSGGAGVFAMDAFQAVRNQLKANYYYGNIALRPTHRTSRRGSRSLCFAMACAARC